MRLLLDQNLSPRLCTALADLYPDSTHVRHVGLQAADDDAVWRYAGASFETIAKPGHRFRVGHPKGRSAADHLGARRRG